MSGSDARLAERPAAAGLAFAHSLRRAEEGDAELLRACFAASRPDVEHFGWDAAAIGAFLDLQWRARELDYATRFPGSTTSVVLVGDTGVGSIRIGRRSAALHLLDIALLPAWRGRGLGTALLGDLVREATHSSLSLRLEVRPDNPARRLYRRAGFTEVSRTPMSVAMKWAGA